jgi:hypothetical protein
MSGKMGRVFGYVLEVLALSVLAQDLSVDTV